MKGRDSDMWRIWSTLQYSLPRFSSEQPPTKLVNSVQSMPVSVRLPDSDKPHPWRYVRWGKAHKRQAQLAKEKKEKPNGNFYHKVLPDEGLVEAATKYETYTEVLMEANKILNPQNIATGQLLWVPRTHFIQRGNTLWSLSRTYGVSISSIQAANGIADPNLIYAGDILVIPKEPDNRGMW